MPVEVTITGLDQWLTICDPDRCRKEMDRAVNKAAEVIRDETKRLPPVSAKTTGYGEPGIPVDSGRMRQSIQKRKLQLLAAEIVAKTNYSGFVHSGTAKMQARPFFLWELEEFGGKEKIEQIVVDALERIANP